MINQSACQNFYSIAGRDEWLEGRENRGDSL